MIFTQENNFSRRSSRGHGIDVTGIDTSKVHNAERLAKRDSRMKETKKGRKRNKLGYNARRAIRKREEMKGG